MVNVMRGIGILLILVLAGCASNDRDKNGGIYQMVADADQAYLESRWLEASQLYSQLTVLVPEDHYAWFRLGNTQIRQGRIDSAIYTYSEALKRDPSHAKTHYNLAIAYMLIATRSMREASKNIRPSDPGKSIVEDNLKALQKLIDQPAEASSNMNRLPHFGGSRSS